MASGTDPRSETFTHRYPGQHLCTQTLLNAVISECRFCHNPSFQSLENHDSVRPGALALRKNTLIGLDRSEKPFALHC